MDVTKKNQKIIALIPFRNEEWILKEFISSVKKITPNIVAYDDGSTDGGTALLQDAGATILKKSFEVKSGWAEHNIRQILLTEGRKLGGTHFICLDADEIFSNNFYKHAEKTILSLLPGQSLWMDWVTLYRDIHTERIDGVYKNINKNFIFCDDKDIEFTYAFLGVSRTPGDLRNKCTVGRNIGSVIHYQYLNIDRSAMKRVWYMCSEHIQNIRTPLRINTTYDIQKDRDTILTQGIDNDAAFNIVDKTISEYKQQEDWRFKTLLEWFEKYGIEFFEPLDIWEIDYFKKLFKEKTGRDPEPSVLPPWLLYVNDIKNKIKVSLYYIRGK